MDDSESLAASLLLASGSEETLMRALSDRQTVGQALGILICRHNVDADRAMHLLAIDAARRGVSLHEAALSTIDACLDSLRAIDPYGWAMSRP